MRPFDLNTALAGEPVKLRNGQKAIVYYRIPDKYVFEDGKQPAFPLHGLILDSEGYIELADVCWRDNGTYTHYPHSYDITGMWEEPVKPQNKILEEAWQNRGKIVKTDAGMTTTVEVVGKTADGEYIVRNPVTGSLDEIGTYGKLNWQPYEEPKGPVDNHKVATLYLPKPNRPREGKSYWCISTFNGKLRVQHERHSHTWACDKNRIEQGNCFASESDAQAWVNALDYARTGKVKIE